MLRLLSLCLVLAAPAWGADFRLMVGHGGPVMDVAVSADGKTAVTGSFDNSVGLWSLESDEVVFANYNETKIRHFWEHLYSQLGLGETQVELTPRGR